MSAAGPSFGLDIFDTALPPTKWHTLQRLVLALCAITIMFDGIDTLMLGFAIPPLVKEWRVDAGEFVPAVALTIIGMSVGTFVLGTLGDRLGRKPLLVASVLLFGFMTLALGVFANGLLVFTMLRTLAAIGLGGTFPNAVALISEYSPPRRRNAAVTFAILCVALGGLAAGLLSAVVLPVFGWRSLFIIGGIAPLLVAFVILIGLPESISFLLKRGKTTIALEMLRRCGGEPLALRSDLPRAIDTVASPIALFGASYRGSTIALWTALFAITAAAYGIFNWGPTLLVRSGFTVQQTGLAIAFFSIGGIVGSAAGGWLMDRFEAQTPTIAFTVSGVVFGLSFRLAGWPSTGGWPLLLGMAALGLSGSGVISMLFSLSAATYPPSLRGLGVGAAVGVGRLGAVASAVFGAGALAINLPKFLELWTIALAVTVLALVAFAYFQRQQPTICRNEAE